MAKLKHACLAFLLFFLACESKPTEQALLPNIVWIMLEDWGHQLSCYGEPGIYTPHIDQLAAEGMRYTRAFTTAPVCSPSRSAMITGFHQNFIGAQQHRTHAKFGYPKKPLPQGILPLTEHLKAAGYHTALMRSKKTDLNFIHEQLFDSKDWKSRDEGQPFFVQATFEWTHRKWRRDSLRPISIDEVEVPPYYPQTDLVKRDWANGLEAAQIVDRQVGALLDRLEKEGLSENTLIFLIGDNGRCMPRGKQFLYDGGLLVPMIIRWPGEVEPGSINEDLVSTLDITRTILDLVGAIPEVPLHGLNLFDESTQNRQFLYAARDKMDSTYDASRAIRSKQYKLIHNLMPERPYLQFNQYKESMYPTLAEMNVMYFKGQLNEEQLPFMAATKPEIELYDLVEDPHELNNLAEDPTYAAVKEEYLTRLNHWRQSINDTGVTEEFRKGGWPADFPTRSLAEWEERRAGFVPWTFRDPAAKMKHPYSKW